MLNLQNQLNKLNDATTTKLNDDDAIYELMKALKLTMKACNNFMSTINYCFGCLEEDAEVDEANVDSL